MDDSQEITATKVSIVCMSKDQITEEIRRAKEIIEIGKSHKIADYIDTEISQDIIFNTENK